MKQNLYAMYDKLAQTYGPPTVARSDVLVAREFVRSMVNYQKQQAEKGLKIDLDDYRLDMLGTFDDESGVIVGCTPTAVPLAYPKGSAETA